MAVIFNPPSGSTNNIKKVIPLTNSEDDFPKACEINTVAHSKIIQDNKTLYDEVSKLISDAATAGLFEVVYEGVFSDEFKDFILGKKYLLTEFEYPVPVVQPLDENENFDLSPINKSTNVSLEYELKLTFPKEMQLSNGYIFVLVDGFPYNLFYINDCNTPGFPSVALNYDADLNQTEIVFSAFTDFLTPEYLMNLSFIIDPQAIVDMTNVPFDGTPKGVWDFQLEQDPLIPSPNTETHTLITWPNSVCIGTL